MKASVRPKVQDTGRSQRREELKKMSDERVKHWPNTLEALRLKKESSMREREAIAELKRQEVDREEAELRRIARLEAIRKANDLLYEQTDKMKMLKSEKLYADVLHTRVSQVGHKKKVVEEEKTVEERYHQLTLEQVARGQAKEEEKLLQAQQRMEQIKISRKLQLEEERHRKEAEAEKLRLEGLEIKRRAQEAVEEEFREMERKHKHAEESNMRMTKANADLKIVRMQIAEQERIAEEARDAQKKVIEDRKIALKRLEAERFARAQISRQKLIDAAVEQLAKKSNSEQAILTKQIEDQRIKDDQALQNKADKAAREWEETVASRTRQIQAKEEALRKKYQEEAELVAKFKRENEEAIQAEKDKVERARLETIRIKQVQYEEGKVRARKKEEERLLEIEQSKFLQALDVGDDDKFVEACKKEIERNVALGKPVYTLLKALHYTAPQLQAAKRVPVKKDGSAT